jgi:hypothetical protein
MTKESFYGLRSRFRRNRIRPLPKRRRKVLERKRIKEIRQAEGKER